jgi:OmpA-OmpF porin, OOP family
MRRLLRAVTATAALGAIIPAAGAQDATGTPSPVPRGWYVAPMATYMKPDSARCGVDSDLGGSLALGHRGEFASLELWGQLLSLPHSGCTYLVPGPSTPDPTDDERVAFTEPGGTVKLNGGGLGLVFTPFSEGRILPRFFALVGFGVLQRKGHPQRAEDDTTIFGDAGLGYMHPFELFGVQTAARIEARYRFDAQQPPHPTAAEQDPPPENSFGDVILNLGLQFALSRAPTPAAAPEPVAVVAVADADGDGVADDIDTCPGTEAGVTIDATGCAPLAALAEPTLETAKAGDTIVLKGVNFETGRATLTANAKTLLDGVAQELVRRADLRIEIGGHTDARGNEGYNQALSEQRAQSVLDYLAGQGVEATRLTAVGYGEAQPVDTNETGEGRERNRRVELKVLEQAPPSAEPKTTGETS